MGEGMGKWRAGGMGVRRGIVVVYGS